LLMKASKYPEQVEEWSEKGVAMLCDGYKRLGREKEFVDLIGSRPHSLGLVPHGSASGTQALIKIDAYFIMGLAVDQVEELKAQMKEESKKHEKLLVDQQANTDRSLIEQQAKMDRMMCNQQKTTDKLLSEISKQANELHTLRNFIQSIESSMLSEKQHNCLPDNTENSIDEKTNQVDRSVVAAHMCTNKTCHRDTTMKGNLVWKKQCDNCLLKYKRVRTKTDIT
jgi:hypothetical protein